MASVPASCGVRRQFATSVLARLPLEMLGIGLLIHARQVSGSFATAGLVTGVYALAVGLGGPLLGRLADQRGQTAVLLSCAGISAAGLVTIAVLPNQAPLMVLIALAAGVGLVTPPVGACFRARLPKLLSDPAGLRRAYALEASLLELTYVAGPPLALFIAQLWSTGIALAVAGLILLVATAAFGTQPTSTERPSVTRTRPARGPLGSAQMRTLVIVLGALGVLLGADEVAVIAAARTLHDAAFTAPLFAVWGTGSLLGGLVVARLSTADHTTGRLVLLLASLTAGQLALIAAVGNVGAIGAVLLVAGAAIAPTEASVNAMVEQANPGGVTTEAFAWLATAMALGGAIGTAGAGIAADRGGAAAAFALGFGAGVLALLTSLCWSRAHLGSNLNNPELRSRVTVWH